MPPLSLRRPRCLGGAIAVFTCFGRKRKPQWMDDYLTIQHLRGKIAFHRRALEKIEEELKQLEARWKVSSPPGPSEES